MFIELTAAFRGENQPDFESLNIRPKGEDFEDVEWDTMWVYYDCICQMYINDTGNTNIIMINGQMWTVAEKPPQIRHKISEAIESRGRTLSQLINNAL